MELVDSSFQEPKNKSSWEEVGELRYGEGGVYSYMYGSVSWISFDYFN